MIGELKPYNDYKVCENSSLGKVPHHWRIARIKSVLTESDQRTKDGRGTLLSLSRVRGLIDRTKMTDKAPSARTLIGYKLFSPGQIVMNRMQAWSGMFGSGRISGLVSPDYAVYSQRSSEHVDFLLARLKNYDLVAEYRIASRGIGTGFNRLYNDRFGPIRISLPPPDEQELIVRFLDWASVRLGKAIAAKRKVIGLLEEQKQAIIHRAVTRGLDDTVPLKPSGLDWLGDVPEHWERRKLKFIGNSFGGMTPNKGNSKFWQGTIPWVSPKDMKVDRITDAIDHITETALASTNIRLLPQGCVLFVVRGMILARRFPVAVNDVRVCINQDMKAILPGPSVDSHFLAASLRGNEHAMLALVEESGHGTRCLRTEMWETLELIFPPSLVEQQSIVRGLNERLAALEVTRDHLVREIQLLQEYRTRLIADVVTGKLDVRDFARSLPADIAEEAAKLASSELGDDELSDSDDELADELAGETI